MDLAHKLCAIFRRKAGVLLLEKCWSIPGDCMAFSRNKVTRNQTVAVVANGGSPADIPQLDMGI